VAVSGTFARILRSPSFKFILTGFLVFAVSLPLALVWLMLSDRQNRATTVQSEIAKDWGGGQRVSGPYLIVPYTAKSRAVDAGKQIEVERERFAIFLPDTLDATAGVSTEIRKRSIYDVTVYKSAIQMEGRFPAADIGLADSNAVAARWQDAILALGISDVTGLKNNVELEIDGGKTIAFEPSIGIDALSYPAFPGIHARLALSGEAGSGSLKSAGPLGYKIDLNLNGSSYLRFAPVGRDTAVSMKSGWPHPGFTGFLPISHSIGESGFTASWRVPHLARSVPQAYSESSQQASSFDRFGNADLGVNLFVPVDFYSLVDRTLKYGFMFIAAIFGAVFVM